jgi:hypothetical protein
MDPVYLTSFLPQQEDNNSTISQLQNLGFKWRNFEKPEDDLFLNRYVDLPTGWEKGTEMSLGSDMIEFYIADERGIPRVLVWGKTSYFGGDTRLYDCYSSIEILDEARQKEVLNKWDHKKKKIEELKAISERKEIKYQEACSELMKARTAKWDPSHTWSILMICIPKQKSLEILYACGGFYSTEKEATQAATLLQPNRSDDLYVRVGKIIDPSKTGALFRHSLVDLSSHWSGGFVQRYVTRQKRDDPRFPSDVMVKESIKGITPRGKDGIDVIDL